MRKLPILKKKVIRSLIRELWNIHNLRIAASFRSDTTPMDVLIYKRTKFLINEPYLNFLKEWREVD